MLRDEGEVAPLQQESITSANMSMALKIQKPLLSALEEGSTHMNRGI